MIIQHEQIRAELTALGVKQFLPYPKDKAYFCPSLDWLINGFEDWCTHNQIEYQDESADCDNIAIETVADLSRAFRASKRKGSDCAGFICCLTIVPTATYFDTVFDWDNRRHVNALLRLNDNKWYAYERSQARAIPVETLLADSVIDTLDFVFV